MEKFSEYSAPAHKSTTVHGSYTGEETAGIEGGLSSRKNFDSEMSSDFKVNNGTSKSGNPRQIVKPKESYSVSSKGNSFDVGA